MLSSHRQTRRNAVGNVAHGPDLGHELADVPTELVCGDASATVAPSSLEVLRGVLG